MGATSSVAVLLVAMAVMLPNRDIHSIQGKTALVTGSSQGIGKAIALRFAEEGVSKLGLCSRNLDKAEEAAEDIRRQFSGVHVSAFRCDVSKPQSRDKLVSDVLNSFGSLDILVNNAGLEKSLPYQASPPEEIELVIDVNVKGAAHLTRAFLPQMIEQGQGHIVMMSSLSGKIPLPYSAVYTGTRFFTYGFASALRGEMIHAKTGVTVHTVLPGAVEDTGMFRKVIEENDNVPIFHWSFGSAGAASVTAEAVVRLIKTDYPEAMINVPSMRPSSVLMAIFPCFYDYLLWVWPEVLDDYASLVEKRALSNALNAQ